MHYTDKFLRALGEWQHGWKEDLNKRKFLAKQLIEATKSDSPGELPMTNPLPPCFRKRYLFPGSDVNPGDITKLVLRGFIDEGISSWTTDKGFAEEFKDLFRPNCITAIFEHTPGRKEVILDIVALWKDSHFRDAVKRYTNEGGDFASALTQMANLQFELILDVPLLAEEVIDFVGFVGEESAFFEALGARTEVAQDIVWTGFANLNVFPGDAVWTGRKGAKSALQKVQSKYKERYIRWLWHLHFKIWLLDHTNHCHPDMFRALTPLNDLESN